MNKWQERQEEKRQIIEENQTARLNRSAKEQLARLDARLGKGVGAVKERAKLNKILEGEKT